MAGMEDHHVHVHVHVPVPTMIANDWVPPSPSPSPSPSPTPTTFFSSLLADDHNNNNNNTDYFSSVHLFQNQMVSDEKPNGVKQPGSSEQLNTFFFEEEEEEEHKGTSRGRGGGAGGLVERIAARAGFNAPRLNTQSIRSTTDLSSVRSPYLTIPPGLSPTTLLDSPVFLSNSLAQPSPTTGKFLFLPNCNNNKSSKLVSETADRSRDNHFEDINNASSFAFKPVAESGSSFFSGAATKITPAIISPPFPSIEVSIQSENSLQCGTVDPSKGPFHSSNGLHLHPDFPISTTEKDTRGNIIGSDPRDFDSVGGGGECSPQHSPPLDVKQDEEGDQRGIGDSGIGGDGPSEDVYNWRKYGQKQVKGSEYPRSYYKCTHPNCQVKKKVERSHEGHITEIIYKGAHNHPKPPPNRRSTIGSSNPFGDTQFDNPEQAGLQCGADGDLAWPSTQKGTAAGASDWRNDNLEVTSAPVAPEFCNQPSGLQAQHGTYIESGDAVDASSTFSNNEDEDDRGTHGSVSLGYDGEGDESESKRRKVEAYTTEISGATRAIREPRVVVQTTSEVDILDDGYRWRKYGQKVVKGNPNPRSYYKCTNAGCTVRKHVERASHDLKSVITTYEGKHNHDVPAARNSSHVNSAASSALPHQTAVQMQVHRPEPSQIHNSMARFERSASVGSFSLPGRQQLGPSNGFHFGLNQPGLANLTMAGLGPNQGKLPIFPVNQYLGQQHQINDMVFMMPKGEPKVEPMSESGLNLSNSSSVYQQIMSRLPLGPQM